MDYIAHAGVQLTTRVTTAKINKLHFIKQNAGVSYYWRLFGNHTYELIAGPFNDRYDALKCAKQMYVRLLYSVLKRNLEIVNSGCDTYPTRMYHESDKYSYEEYLSNEEYFFWTKNYTGGLCGPGVYEVDKTVEDFNNYEFIFADIGFVPKEINLEIKEPDEYIFTYSQESQRCLSIVVDARNICDLGMKMTLYCGLLEHLGEDREKESEVILEINECINNVGNSLKLKSSQMKSLISALGSLKRVSSRQKCIELISKYAKNNYGEFKAKNIFDKAYRIRSAFSHGGNVDDKYSEKIQQMLPLVLDVIQGYFIDREKSENDS